MSTPTPTLSVRLRATYDESWFAEECGRCGAEVVGATRETDYRPMYRCPEHGLIGPEEVNPAEDPHEAGGWCSVSNPWGDRGSDISGHHEGTGPGSTWAQERDWSTVTVTPWEAAEIVAAFPGEVWDRSESEYETDLRTGHSVGVTLHIVDHEPMVNALADIVESIGRMSAPAEYGPPGTIRLMPCTEPTDENCGGLDVLVVDATGRYACIGEVSSVAQLREIAADPRSPGMNRMREEWRYYTDPATFAGSSWPLVSPC